MGYQIKPKLTVASNLPTVDNGSMIGTTDSGDLYIDADGKRVKITDVITGTLSSIMATVAPLPNKLYFATDTHQLLQASYSNNTLNWLVLNGGSGSGSSGTGDWGTKVVSAPAANGATKTSIIATPSFGDNNGVRGNGAVDLQMFRAKTEQVASGTSSFVAGRYNKASGAFATTFGEANVAAGNYSTVFGNQNRCRIDGVVCNNNINNPPSYRNYNLLNFSGHCGFKGLKAVGWYYIPIMNLSLTDVLIATVHIIVANENAYHQVQNVVVSNCELQRNEIEYSSGNSNSFQFRMNNGRLEVWSPDYDWELQIGVFYTLYSQAGINDSSSSSSGSGSGSSSSSSSEYYPDIPETSSSSSQ